MTLLQFKYFIAVAEMKNITHAAEYLYTSQPTVSRQIQMLEVELGYSLFNRRSKPLELTEAGRILYDGIKEAFSQINLTLDTAKIASQGKSGRLSIAFQIGYYCEFMFFPIIEDLQNSWPSLNITYTKLTTTEQHEALKTGRADIVIGIDFPHWQEAGYVVRKLQKEETLIVMSKKHRLASKDHLDFNDIEGETFFLTEPNGYQVDKIFKNILSLKGVKQIGVPLSEVAYFRTIADNGLTISNPHDPYLNNNPYFHTIPFKSDYSDTYACVYNPDNSNPVIKLFLEKLNEI